MSTRQTNGHANGSAHGGRGLSSEGREPIAIVGIGCRFPGGANDPDAFWRLLDEGRDAITEVPADRWSLQSFYDPDPSKPGKSYSRWGGFVEGIDRFDPGFFGISPREAARMDPQQRMLLEVAWEGLENGGQTLERIAGSPASVFVGISSFDYSVLETSFRDRAALDVYSNTGGSLSIAANRISYCFNLRGPSAAVDTACSSALVAVHLACESIWRDGCTLALAGGVNALLLPDWYVGFCRMGMLSPEGRCRAFDARAGGFVRSEGAGMVVLKPLSSALADGDRVYAVIRGTAVNQDGRTPGMTVPSQDAQEALIRKACREAGVAPALIEYVEAHGTGTLVGDPIEARAIGRVLAERRPAGPACVVGSVKTNIGHLEAGSGIAGLIKVALALHHRRIPGNLHFDHPNPEIDFDALRLRVPTRSEPWPAGQGPALAGINSFGFGGTNAHAIVQEAPRATNGAVNGNGTHAAPATTERACLVPVSARSPEALRAAARALAEVIADGGQNVVLGDLAASAALRRTHHDHRLAIVAQSNDELRESLLEFAEGRPPARGVHGRAPEGTRAGLAFVCSGQGPQWWAMGRDLLRDEPVFRAAIERCDAIVRRLGTWSLLDELTADETASKMDDTAIAQPCLFAIQIALGELWASWGIRPEALMGHSVGEVAAAYLAGILDLDDAVTVIYHRGRCMAGAPGTGRMVAAALTVEEAQEFLAQFPTTLTLAAVNSPTSVTLSGEAEAVERVAAELESRRVFARVLKVHYAFHSAQMDPIRDELLASLAAIRPRQARLPFVSTVTGNTAEGPELDAEYWWRNVREAVQFADGMDRLVDAGCETVVELGPHPVLAASAAECLESRGKAALVVPSLRRREDERATMLRSLAELHAAGHPVDWAGLYPGKSPFVALPRYPWQRERCWFESEESRTSRFQVPVHPLLGAPKSGPQAAWEGRLDLRLTPYLVDHRVQRGVIVPATAYIELGLAAGRAALGAEGCELRRVALANPCFLSPDAPLWLQTSYDAESGTVRVHTRSLGSDGEWTGHMTAVLFPLSRFGDNSAFSHDAIRARCPRAHSRERTYEYLKRIGLDYGPQFQGIDTVWQGDRESLGLVELPESLETTAADYLVHPALLDACFQVVIPADADFDHRNGGLYLPCEIDRVRFFRSPAQRVWVHARLRDKTAHRSLADIDVYDESGRLVVEIRGLHSRRVAGGQDESLDALLYAYQWRPQPVEDRVAATPAGQWLIFADYGGTAARLAQHLEARGDSCTLVYAGESYAEADGQTVLVGPSRLDDFRQLVATRVGPHIPRCRGVVHLWNLDAAEGDRLEPGQITAAQDAGLLSVIHLVQAWDQAAPDQSAPLVLVTRGAQPVAANGQVAPLAMLQSPVVGLGRVIAGEYPRLKCRLVDLDPNDDDGGVALLLAELQARDDEDEVALRGEDRLVRRYLPAPGLPEAVGPTPAGPYRLGIRRPGMLDGLVPHALHRSPPGPGLVEIEVYAAGLNFSDVMKVLGLYPGLPDGPIPLGAECSGVVTAVGAGVHRVKVGDEVVAVAGFAFGSHVLTRAELVAIKPPAISFEDAATLPIAFLTAAYALEWLARLSEGESVLIHSATGGVGLAAVQIARRLGARVLATAGTDEKRSYLRELGVETVMDSRSLAFSDEARSATGGRGVDAILNSLPGPAIAAGIDALADYGRFLEIGKRDIYQNARLGLEPFRKNLSFFAIDLDRVMRERPALLGALLDEVMRRVRDGELAPLPHRDWPVGDAVEAFRFMQQARHVGKVVLTLRGQEVAAAPSEDEPLSFRGEGTYLVTGGLGGFGLEVARWLARRGAGTLVLMGRRGAEAPGAAEAVTALEGLGSRVVIRAGDVAKPDDLAAVLAEIDRDLPPLRGVFHAAMVLEDALLVNLDRSLMDRVLAPKVSGTWNLHTQTSHRSLDHFVMFSSLSSVFGHAGQGNYAAANAFLDALAWHRRAQGLPALTVNWGYLGDVGYLARRAELGGRLERQGVLSFSVEEALILLERALQRGHVQVSVMRLEWSRWRGLGATSRISPRFAHLCRADDASIAAAGAGACGPEALEGAAPEARAALVEGLLRDKLARVLGTAAERIDSERPLLQLGIDSLMAVELRNWVESELRVNLPIVELMRSPSLTKLAEVLAEHVSASRTEAAHESERNGTSSASRNGHGEDVAPLGAATDELLARVDDLSGEQVDALLATLLNERGNRSRP